MPLIVPNDPDNRPSASKAMQELGSWNWKNLLYFRTYFTLAFGSLIAAMIGQAVLGSVGAYIGFIGGGLCILAGLLAPETVMVCPSCRKRSKIGATACRFCGRDLGNS